MQLDTLNAIIFPLCGTSIFIAWLSVFPMFFLQFKMMRLLKEEDLKAWEHIRDQDKKENGRFKYNFYPYIGMISPRAMFKYLNGKDCKRNSKIQGLNKIRKYLLSIFFACFVIATILFFIMYFSNEVGGSIG